MTSLQVTRSDSVARDFNTGNLVKEFDETNDEESNDAQSTNNVKELANDEEEDEDER